MHLTTKQLARFGREWERACQVQGWTKENGYTFAMKEVERHKMLLRIGFSSLKLVDTNKGFTALLKELATLQDNLAGMLRADGNQVRQLRHAITCYDAPYWQAIAQDRFGTTDLESMTEAQLVQLRNTLADRSVEQHHPGTLARRSRTARIRRSTPHPQTRIQFEPPPRPESGIPSTITPPISEEALADCPF